MKRNEVDIIAATNFKWIEFEIIERKPKTVVIQVISKDDGYTLGLISWYPSWRCYSFSPNNSTIFEKTCLNNIATFLDILNKNQKDKE